MPGRRKCPGNCAAVHRSGTATAAIDHKRSITSGSPAALRGRSATMRSPVPERLASQCAHRLRSALTVLLSVGSHSTEKKGAPAPFLQITCGVAAHHGGGQELAAISQHVSPPRPPERGAKAPRAERGQSPRSGPGCCDQSSNASCGSLSQDPSFAAASIRCVQYSLMPPPRFLPKYREFLALCRLLRSAP